MITLNNISSHDNLTLDYYNYRENMDSPRKLRIILSGTTNTSFYTNNTVGFMVGLGIGALDRNNASFAVCTFVNQTLNETIMNITANQTINGTNSTNSTMNNTIACFEVYYVNDTSPY
jgi:hypothetical protein